jgi:hypothetical protein
MDANDRRVGRGRARVKGFDKISFKTFRRSTMKKILWLCTLWLWPVVLASPAAGQERVVHSGNTDIIFKPADPLDLPLDRYKAFDEFADDHPELIHALSRNPKLAASPKYLKKHPELTKFFDEHPDIKADFLMNPGNYVAPVGRS